MIFGIGDTVYVTGGTLNNIQAINSIHNIQRLGEVTEVKRVDNVSIKALPCPKVNDAGLNNAWYWADKIAVAVSLWATYETWKAAKEEYKIGLRYYELAKEQWDHFYEYYRPLEDQELSEIWAEKPYDPDYSTASQGHTNLIDAMFSSANRHRQALTSKYCVCPDVSEFTKSDIVKSTVYGDSDNFARRYAEKLAQEKNDIRWARRVAAASRGRNLLTSSTSFASKAAGFFSDYGRALSGLASQASEFSGYAKHRWRTEYNPVRTSRIDSRSAVPNFYNGMDTITAVDRIPALQTMNERYEYGGTMVSGSQPFMPSGFDPTGYAKAAPAI